MPKRTLDIQPLDGSHWKDLETLFGGPGGSQVRGCWCMCYRRSGRIDKPADMTYGQFNKCSLKALVDRGIVPGARALIGDEADRRQAGMVDRLLLHRQGGA